jgi:hypothetical protein
MDRVAVFVDAGYLFAQGSVALAGQKLPRGRLVLDHEKAIDALADFATRVSGVDLLRVYWYGRNVNWSQLPAHHAGARRARQGSSRLREQRW